MPPELDDDGDGDGDLVVEEIIVRDPPDDWPGSDHAGWTMLPPLAGGAPYEPTAEDLDDYRRWAEDLDRRRDECPYGYE